MNSVGVSLLCYGNLKLFRLLNLMANVAVVVVYTCCLIKVKGFNISFQVNKL